MACEPEVPKVTPHRGNADVIVDQRAVEVEYDGPRSGQPRMHPVSVAAMLAPVSPRNCIVLGSGRSGTSMVAGAIAAAGHFMGDDLHPARDANPKGFFEGPTVKDINEDLLAQVVSGPLRWPASLLTRGRTSPGSRWLARLPPHARVVADGSLATR